jgi:hypothetical protein
LVLEICGRADAWQVWEGAIARQSFKNFRFESFDSESAARKFLQDRGVGHYWDFVKNFDIDKVL